MEPSSDRLQMVILIYFAIVLSKEKLKINHYLALGAGMLAVVFLKL